ncbi:MAG TPA: formate dehydrogenase accessory protein FdhE [Bacillota bacterium]|nr:formate dehydrogenase accessory protein FdhE [Bacillota bacterium]
MPFGLAVTWPEFKKEMDRYQPAAGIDNTLIRFYEQLFQIWYDFRERITGDTSLWKSEEIKELLRQGRFLLHGRQVPVDGPLYRQALSKIVEALSCLYPETGGLQKLLELSDLQGQSLAKFLAESASFDGEKMVKYVREQKWDEMTGVEAELAAFVLFQALGPFYQSLGASVAELSDFSLWQHGFCPLCGQKPGMAMLRPEDGARILECWLCHLQWQFPRLECPFCANKDFTQLQFFYTEEHPGRRVQLCDCCKSYLKTVVTKEIGREVILELENIFTIELDFLARREGFLPGENLTLLS